MAKLSVLGLAPALIWLAAACGGDSKPEPVSLAEYFSQIDAIFKEQEQRSEVIGEGLNDRLNLEAVSIEEALEAAAEVLPQLFSEIEPVFQDAIDALDRIEPPAEVAAAHEAMLDAYRDLLAFFVELDDGLESGESVQAALEALFLDASANEISQRLESALNDLQADANNIEVQILGATRSNSVVIEAPRQVDEPPDEPVVIDQGDGPVVVESSGGNDGRPVPAAVGMVQFESIQFGIGFMYQVEPDEFVLRRIETVVPEFVVGWTLTRRSALDGQRGESEGAPGISIEVFEPRPAPASAEEWVRQSNRSNFGLGSGELTAAAVGGQVGVAYGWSGLYEGRSVVMLVDGRIWMFSATSSGDFSEIEGAFRALLRTVILTRP